MSAQLTFTSVYSYDTRKSGISVPVSLRYGPDSIQVIAKLDTGASFCIFEGIHGKRLGLNLESGIPQRVHTVTGSFLTYGHEITIETFGIETVATVYFAADDSFTRNVLGRQGWLDRVRLGLVDYEGKLYLNPYDQAESSR